MHKSDKPIIKHVPDFLDYLEIEKGLGNKTQENYARFLNRFSEWLKISNKGDLLPHELTPELIWDYRVYLSRETKSKKINENLKKSTQNYYLIALRGLLNFFAERDITAIPGEKVKLAKSPKEHSIHFLNLDQIKVLLEAPDIKHIPGLRDRAILESLFSTGLRVAELAKLNCENFKIRSDINFLEINVIGKGSHPRTVYFSERALYWLKAYLEKRVDIDPALFINFKPGKEQVNDRRLTVRSIESIVKKYVKIAGLPLTTTPHTLRHSYATDLLTQGVDLRLVQEFLGHKNIATTQIYTHVTNKKLRDVYLKYHSGAQDKK